MHDEWLESVTRHGLLRASDCLPGVAVPPVLLFGRAKSFNLGLVQFELSKSHILGGHRLALVGPEDSRVLLLVVSEVATVD